MSLNDGVPTDPLKDAKLDALPLADITEKQLLWQIYRYARNIFVLLCVVVVASIIAGIVVAAQLAQNNSGF